MLFFSSSVPMRLSAQDSGKVDGAIWTIQLTAKTPGRQRLRGAYRINSHVIFQKENPPEGDFVIEVGKNFPRGGKTRTKFESLVLRSESLEKVTLQGTALLSVDRFGEWSGTLIDSSGRHWDCRVRRVQE